MLRRKSPKRVALSGIDRLLLVGPASEPIGRRKPDRDGFVERPHSEGPALEEARQRMFAVRRATKSLELG